MYHFAAGSLFFRILAIMFLTPRPSSLPGIALMLGGVGYPAFALTLMGTLIAGITTQRLAGTAAFGAILMIGCVLPFALAQLRRKLNPSQARSLGEKWGFLSVIAMATFAFCTLLRIAPSSFSEFEAASISMLLVPLLALVVFKGVGFITSLIATGEDSVAWVDVYLGHSTVNFVFLGAVLSSAVLGSNPLLTLAVTIAVFALILVDERILQFVFEREFGGRDLESLRKVPLILERML